MARYSAPPYSLKTVRTTQPQTPVKFSDEGNAVGAFAYVGGTNFVIGEGKTIGLYGTLTSLGYQGLPNGTNSTGIGNYGAVGISPIPTMIQITDRTTFIIQWMHGDTGVATNMFGGGDNNGNYVEQFGLCQDSAGAYNANNIRFVLRDSTGNSTSIITGADLTLTVGTVYTVAIVYKGTVGGTSFIDFWVNGKQISYSTVTSGTGFNNQVSAPMTQATHYSVGNFYYGLSDVTGNVNSKISLFARIPKQLDGKAVSINPWRIFAASPDPLKNVVVPGVSYFTVKDLPSNKINPINTKPTSIGVGLVKYSNAVGTKIIEGTLNLGYVNGIQGNIGNGTTAATYKTLTNPIVVNTGSVALISVFSGNATSGTLVSLGSSSSTTGGYLRISKTTGGQILVSMDSVANADGLAYNTTQCNTSDNNIHCVVAVFTTYTATIHGISVYCDGKFMGSTSTTGWNNSTYDIFGVHCLRCNATSGYCADWIGYSAIGINISNSAAAYISGNAYKLFRNNNSTLFQLASPKLPVSVRESRILPTSGPIKSSVAPFILKSPKYGQGDRLARLGKPVPEVLAAMHTGNGLVEMVSGLRVSAASNLVNRAKGPVFIAAATPTPRMRLANNRADFTAFGIAIVYGSDSSGAFIYMLDPGTGYGWRGGLYAASGSPSIGIGGYWNGAITSTIIGAHSAQEYSRPIHWAIAYSATNATMSAFVNGRHVGTNTSVGALDPFAGPNPGFNPYDTYSVNNGLSTAGVIAGYNFEKAKYISSNVYAMFNPAKSDDRWASI